MNNISSIGAYIHSINDETANKILLAIREDNHDVKLFSSQMALTYSSVKHWIKTIKATMESSYESMRK